MAEEGTFEVRNKIINELKIVPSKLKKCIIYNKKCVI